MSAYKPSAVPATLRAAGWMATELARISNAINSRWRLKVLHAEPDKYAAGDLVYADGSDWNPGSGEGVYVRTSSAWVKL